METSLVISLGIAFVVIIVIAKTAVIVPQQSAFVVENLGKYSRTLKAGFHILFPFVERTAYKHSLKELAADIPPLANKLIKKFWPGPLTIIFRARPSVSDLITAGTGKIGLRQSPHPLLEYIFTEIGRASCRERV